MKKENLKFLFIAIVMALFTFACEKDELTVNEDGSFQNQELFELPSLVKTDSASESNPEALKDEYLMPVRPEIEALKYLYDKSGRLALISYYNKIDISLSTATTEAKPVMTDKFTYGSDGRLIVLLRNYNSETSPGIAISIRKTYSYDRSGRLVKIITEKPDITAAKATSTQIEVLQYDNMGLLFRKDVKTPWGAHYFLYKHDELQRLKIEALFSQNGFAKYYCEFNYDRKNNIAYKEYFYPNNIHEAVRGWIEKYEYDDNPNPFKNMKLPVSSLFDWMDMVSNNNFTMIANPDKMVRYKYQYELNGYPVLRLRVE